MSEPLSTLGPYALLKRLSDAGSVQERFIARRVAGGDVGGPVVLTRREGDPLALAGLVRAWCEMAIKREGAGHAGVTRCLEVGKSGPFLFEVSELADGESLAALLKRYHDVGEHPPLDVALAVASALAHLIEELGASGVGIGYAVPDHVILTWDGRVVLERVGVPDENTRRSAWCAPELQKGTGADQRTDVWALGRLFKAVLVGHKGTSARVPARYAKPTKGLLQQLMAASRKRRLNVADARQRIDAFLDEIGAPGAPALLANVMAERFVEHAAADDDIDVVTLKRLGRETAAAEHFFPRDQTASPLPEVPVEAARDETLSDTHQPFAADKTEASAQSPQPEELSSPSSSDEAGGLDIGDVFSDPNHSVRTQITAVTTPQVPRGLLASAATDGSLPWADAMQLDSLDGPMLSEESGLTTPGSDLPSELQLGDDGLDALPSLTDPSPSPYARHQATEVSAAPALSDLTNVDEGPPSSAPDAAATAMMRKKTPAPPDAETRTGTGARMPALDPLSVEDVWAESAPMPAAPGGLDPLGSSEEATSTEVVELPDASVSELRDDEPLAAPPPALEEAAQAVHAGTDPERDVFASAPGAEAGGLLVVDAPAGAVVHVDGENRGSGRLTVEGVPRTGSIRIRVTLGGHRPWVAEVSLEGQPAAKVTPRLVPAR